MSNAFEKYAEPIIAAIDSGHAAETVQQSDDPWPRPRADELEYSRIRNGEFVPEEIYGSLDDGDYELIDELIREYGIEILAFYKSIHRRPARPFAGDWGIFVYDWALEYLDDRLQLKRDSKHRMLAWEFLLEHELYHFWVDGWTLGHEDITRSRLYVPYLTSVYGRLFPSAICVEESLANHCALQPSKFKPIKPKLIRFCSQQPPAYRGFDRPVDELKSTLASQILRRHDWLAGYLSQQKYAPMLPSQVPWLDRRKHGPFNPANCPLFRIRGIRPSEIVPPLVLPTKLELDGFLFDYLQGSSLPRTDHEYVKIDNGETIKVPNPHGSDQIKKAEFKNIHLKAGMTGIEYNRERDRTKMWRRGTPREVPKPSRI